MQISKISKIEKLFIFLDIFYEFHKVKNAKFRKILCNTLFVCTSAELCKDFWSTFESHDSSL